MNRIISTIKQLDWWVLVPLTYLIVLGITIQYAILFKTKGVRLDFDLSSQILAIFIAIAAIVAVSYFSQETIKKFSYLIYGAIIIALTVMLFISTDEDTARWLDIGPFRFQPTEIAKLTTIFVLSSILATHSKRVNRFRVLIYSLIIVAIPIVLTALQPDLGTALVFVAIWGGTVLASKIKFSKIALIIILAMTIGVLMIPFLAEYQQNRLISYFDPSYDTQGINYNSVQAGIAIGSGGVFGRGLDSGTQSQLNFLPSQHTDFAYAVTAEKLGLIGAGSIIIAMTLILIRLTFVAWTLKNPYSRCFVMGVVAFLFFHTLVNIGMNVGVLPVTGLPLPFISYGGTFMFVSVFSVLFCLILQIRDKKYQQ